MMNIKTFAKAYKHFTGKKIGAKLPFINGKMANDTFGWFQIEYEYYADIKHLKKIYRIILN